MRWWLALILAATTASAQDRAGEFDYYVLALSWQPTWCAQGGAGSEQCEAPTGWMLHGLWPQHERGWPADCPGVTRDPTRAETAAMADIMGSAGSAWHQWRKHGRCSGLPPEAYFSAARTAFEATVLPEAPLPQSAPRRVAIAELEAAFLAANPDWTADTVTLTCRDGRVHEARVCLTRDLAPRDCAADVVRDCTLDDALMAPIR